MLAASLCAVALAEVRVETHDGRAFSGQIDSRSSEQALWVRQEENGIVLASRVQWEDVSSAMIDGEAVAIGTLASSVRQLASASPPGMLVEYGPHPELIAAAPLVKRHGRITSLEVDARLVNLDRTAEPDGYEIVIAAIDEYGHEVPVRGNLYVRLQGERNEHYSGRIRFENLQQWSQPVREHDFVDGLAMYVLQFRRGFGTEFDDELRPDAQLNVRLGVFGDGNFSATVPVPLWEFSPFKDRLQMFDGSRFFRDEITHRTRHLSNDPPGIYRRVWRNQRR